MTIRYGARPPEQQRNREVEATAAKIWSTAVTVVWETDPDVIKAVLPPPLEPSEPLARIRFATVDMGTGIPVFGAGWFGVRARHGRITFDGKEIQRTPTSAIVKSGLALVPEARRIFPRMTVHENLLMGAYSRSNTSELGGDIEQVQTLFPRLKERTSQIAGTLSGGEQQMLAMGRALMARPRLICMDEPSMGLSPILVQTVFDTIQQIRRQGVTVFLVEQNAFMALNVADRGYVLQQGRIVLSDTGQNLLNNDLVRRAYLGG